MDNVINNILGTVTAYRTVLSDNFKYMNDVLISDLTRRGISGGIDVGEDIASAKLVQASTISQIYNNAKADGYSTTQTFNTIMAAQLNEIANHIKTKASVDLKA